MILPTAVFKGILLLRPRRCSNSAVNNHTFSNLFADKSRKGGVSV